MTTPAPPRSGTRRDRLRRATSAAATLGGVLLVAWIAGFVWFVHMAAEPSPPPPVADGLVVLTGGADRVTTALHLLAEGRARKLLISGVGHGTDLAELAHGSGIDPATLADRVSLGRSATTTRGNAAETSAWARDNDIRTLIVVTAGYHMPRALTELSRALPGVRLYPVPVQPPAMRSGFDGGTLRLLAAEYTKWLAATLGLSRLQTAPPTLA